MPLSSGSPVHGLGVIIPTYNEADNIGHLISEILTVVPQAQIAVVDDSPGPSTKDAVERLGLPCVAVTHRGAKGGRGSAVLDGVRQLLELGCSQILEMDADFSHPPSQIPDLLREAGERRLDLLIASRYLPQSEIRNWPLSRRVFSKCSNMLTRAVLGVPVVDYTNGFRLYSSAAARTIRDTCGREGRGFIALSEILVNVHYRGLRVGETRTIFVNRARGQSSVNLREITDAVTGLVKIYFVKRRLERRKG
jgi:dolichol-phosphate mannosyltransferase